MTWEQMTNLKESNLVQFTECALADKIVDEPAFAWWIASYTAETGSSRKVLTANSQVWFACAEDRKGSAGDNSLGLTSGEK